MCFTSRKGCPPPTAAGAGSWPLSAPRPSPSLPPNCPGPASALAPLHRHPPLHRQPQVIFPRRIFVIGFNKAGYTSLRVFFERSGLKVIQRDDGLLALRMAHNVRQGLPIITGYEDYDVIVDMEYRCEHLRLEMQNRTCSR